MYYFNKKVAPILALNSNKGFEAAKKLLVENNQPPTGLWDWIGINPPRAALMQWDEAHCVMRIRIEPSWYYNGGKDWLSLLLQAQYCKDQWGEVLEGRRFYGFSPKGGGSWIFCFPNDKFKPEETVEDEDFGESAHVLAADERSAPVQEQIGMEIETSEPAVEEPKKVFVPVVRNRSREARQK